MRNIISCPTCDKPVENALYFACGCGCTITATNESAQPNESGDAEAILNKHLYNKFDETDRRTFLAAMQEYAAQQKTGEDVESVLEWLTRKDSLFSIMYGGTPELEKDYRFATNDGELTIKELINKYKEYKATL